MTNHEAKNNGELNKQFLEAIGPKKQAVIITSMLIHYGCSSDDAIKEVTCDEAEHLLEYLVDPIRARVHAMMKERGVSDPVGIRQTT